MHRKILFICSMLAFVVAGKSWAQGSNNSPARPDIPGNLMFDLGVNLLMDNGLDEFETGIFGSKTVNIYYLHEIRLGESNFSFLPGFGLGLDKYKFETNVTLDVPITNPDTTQLLDLATSLKEGAEVSKTKLAANYFDIPLEFRFYANPNSKNSFRVGLGGKIGILYSAHTKVKYELNDETIKLKDKQDFNLNRFRYGLNARIGFGSFNLYAYYGLSELFETEKGPGNTTMSPLSVGLSINGF